MTGPPVADLVGLGDVTVAPGYVDLQVNGVGDVHFATADGDDWARAGRRLGAAGVVGYLPTICSMPLEDYDAALDRVAAARVATADAALPAILGVHLEGPFLGGAPGAHPPEVVRPMDLDWLAQQLDRHGDLIRLVTLAPEADPGCDGIRLLVGRGVRVALGHSTCTYDAAVAAVAAGAGLATHLFNGMAPLHHRRPGLVAAALDPRVPLTPTLIADGIHVGEPAIALAFAAADPILVSDAVAGTGGDAARLADGTLAGAYSLLDRDVRHVVATGVEPARALAAASDRPAGVLGLTEPPGWVALDADLTVRAAWRDDRRLAVDP
jgi:N-acetylglucosamine-6-phosphate deacetylase